MNVEQARFNMIEQQIRPWNVLEPSVLSLLSAIKREDFVPSACKELAFMDVEIPLPGDSTMLAPRVEARLLQELAPKRHEQVLEIGTGSGFMAALLGHRAQKVVSIEIRPELASIARDNLYRAGLSNVEVRTGDGLNDSAQAEAPWDAVVLSGSVPEVSPALLAQLKVGGRLVAVVGSEPVMQAVRITRVNQAEWRTEALFDTVIAPLEGALTPSSFKF
ncbi:protein-L-isoaspartate carboxylmethyltransferase [Leptothrix ochracea L12]|uniref:Protein-L-isoaspartate O-methyltransferase n=1 Tax=Leptothrix ochracea L12 TaxID=735332 RepID=I4Z5C0_9BURK|nr:protein-L-isoaspartate O-methyltransferase [Leptothrix ochracea]EIM31412.1 protein-L-isoaspartate carboxylmethyltransferase [Leptothrix ochracea L12]